MVQHGEPGEMNPSQEMAASGRRPLCLSMLLWATLEGQGYKSWQLKTSAKNDFDPKNYFRISSLDLMDQGLDRVWDICVVSVYSWVYIERGKALLGSQPSDPMANGTWGTLRSHTVPSQEIWDPKCSLHGVNTGGVWVPKSICHH